MKARYAYLADGTKLAVADSAGNGFEYLGSLVYKVNNNTRTLESTAFGGGRINRTDNGSYDVNYFITDHLGSTRMITDNAGNIKEQNDYYPFGMRHTNANLMISANRWGFNGKEKQVTQNLNYLDYGARMYDDFTGRWFVQDPLAEKYYPISSYVYCLNNPVNIIDPDGKIPVVLAVPWLIGLGKAIFTTAGAATVVLAASTLQGDSRHRKKEDERRESNSQEEDAKIARNHKNTVENNVGKPSPDGTPDPKRGGNLKEIIAIGIGGAGYAAKKIYETSKGLNDTETEELYEMAQQEAGQEQKNDTGHDDNQKNSRAEIESDQATNQSKSINNYDLLKELPIHYNIKP